MTKYNFWTKYKDLAIGIVCVLAFAIIFVSFIFYMTKVTDVYSLDDYGCDNVARMYSSDICIGSYDTRMFSHCFSRDAIKFWYDNNCRELVVNNSVVQDNVLCSADTSTGRIVITGDSRSFSGCTIVVNNDSTLNWVLNKTGVEPKNDTVPLIVSSYPLDCCYPRNCVQYNNSCNHNCEYPVMCYGNWS